MQLAEIPLVENQQMSFRLWPFFSFTKDILNITLTLRFQDMFGEIIIRF